MPTPRAAPGAGRQPPVQRPATSPYFARPFIPTAAGHVLPACADASPRPATRASSAWSAASSASRPATGASARREGAPRAARWSNMTLGDVLPLFDPNINHFSMRRSEGPPGPPLSAREPLQRPRTSSTAKSFAADAAASTLNRRRKVCRPQLWGGGLGAKSQTFDNLRPGEMDRHFHKHILGPSFGGQRKLRVAPGLLEAEAMLAPGMVEARAIAEILEVVQMQEGVFDGTWMNPSCRALWYVPRSLCKLHRWEEFVEYICNLDYIIEGTLEFGVLEVEHQYEVALKYISAQRSNTTAFLTLKQKTIDAYCESTIAAYLEFVKDNRKSLAATARNAFGIALASSGNVCEDAWSHIREFQSLLDRSAVKLPFSETDAVVRVYRAFERAQEHGIFRCLPPDKQDVFWSAKSELDGVMSRMWQSVDDGAALENCANLFLGLNSVETLSKSVVTRMTEEGFNDLALVVSGSKETDFCAQHEVSVCLTVRRPYRNGEKELLQGIAQCTSLREDQLKIIQWRGTSMVLRILGAPPQSNDKGDAEGSSTGASSVMQVRDKLLEMAGDPTSVLRKSGLVRGIGRRSGRWEKIRLALSNTCDMDYESEFIARFVLPALRAKCRRRKIHFAWSDLGSDNFSDATEDYVEVLNRLDAMQHCVIHPPGSHERPFMLALIGSRCGKTYQDARDRAESHEKSYHYLRDPSLPAKLAWVGRDDHKHYSVPYLHVYSGYFRCIDATESVFVLRDEKWLSDETISTRVPAVVRDQFFEHDEEMRKVVSEFKNSIAQNAGRQNRIVSYSPSLLSFLGPKSPQDVAETPEGVFRTEYQRHRTVTIVNRDFWKAMQTNGKHILESCLDADLHAMGTIPKKDLRLIFEEHDIMSLATDSEMVQLIAAYEVDGRGNVDYRSLIHQFTGEGRVRMAGMAKLGLSVYHSLWETIDANFPQSVQPGKRHERDLNEQEVLLDMYASIACSGVNDHIFGQLKEYAHAHETLEVVAVRGSSGSGRSTLLASFARHCMIELGHFTDVIYYCCQPWHIDQDIFSCIIGQLDSSIVVQALAEGEMLTARSLSVALARHAQSRSKDVLIIADGLLSSTLEDHFAYAVQHHNKTQSTRVRLVFGAVPAEHHSASDVLSLSILPLMPNEKMALINFQATRARISLYPEVAANLCKKAKTGNDAKFLVVAVNFLSKYDDQEQLRVMHSMPDTVQDLYSSMIFPFLEQVMGEKAMQHLLGLLYYEQKGGILRSEMSKLVKNSVHQHRLYGLCQDLRSLGITAVTADEDLFIISCDEVRTAIHDRYISHQSVLKDHFQQVFKMEQVLRLFSTGKHSVTGHGLPIAASADTACDARNRSSNIQSHFDAHEHDTRAKRVVNLENNNLTALPDEILTKGSAPEEIAELCVRSNSIKTIHQRISNLANLRNLDLSINSLVTLPEQIGLLRNLQVLDVSDNKILEVASAIWKLSELRILRFCRNKVTHLSGALGGLANLQELRFSRNGLLSLPEEVTNLTNLEVLDLSGNRLAEIPDLLAFQNLRILWLSSNRLSSMPSLCHLPRLEDFDAECNCLDSMPAMMSSYPQLKRINLADNNIQHLDAHIAASTALECLNMCGNKLKTIPTAFSSCTSLKTLAVASNMLTSLPRELCDLVGLTTLDVSGNQVLVAMQMSIITRLHALEPSRCLLALCVDRHLRAWHTPQIGEVPGEIGQLTCLQSLFISDNLLKALPSVLVSMKHITRLDFEGNDIDVMDPVLVMKREEREKRATSPRVAHANSELWAEHEAQMQLLKKASQDLNHERIAHRKLNIGGDTHVAGDTHRVSIADQPEMEQRAAS